MAGSSSLNRFYLILLGVAVIGGGLLYWQVRRNVPTISSDVVVTVADTAGFSGYYLGNENAPVVITEYADYRCSHCQAFEIIQFPDVVRQLVQTGRVRWRYRDFPLSRNPVSTMAAHSAACADDQGKYWAQQAAIYQGAGQWALEAEPSGTFRDEAEKSGLDMKAYDACMMSAKYAGRIKASYDEGEAAGVSATPTFFINGRLYNGSPTSDAFKRIVDSIAPVAAATP